MAFCTQCGGSVNDSARFCTGCGQPVGAPGNHTPPPPPPAAAALNYTIQGDNLQIIRIKLQPGQELYAEAGKMIYKQPQVVWETRMSGTTIGEKVWGAIKRKLMGESLFLTYFHSQV